MRCSRKISLGLLALAMTLLYGVAFAQAPDFQNIGRAPTQDQIKKMDIAIGVEGKELPPGSATAKEGGEIFAKKCAMCHGADLKGGKVPGAPPGAPTLALVGGIGTTNGDNPVKTVGSYWPFATTVYDFINRGMPRGAEGSLTPSEVYGVVAFILYKNGIIKEADVMDAKTLPKVQMPNRNGFLPAKFEDIADLKKRGCKVGQCPEK